MTSDIPKKPVDADTVYHCAYNFPAVLLTIGPERWDELSEIHENFANNGQIRVRKTIASSLYQVARIIGGDRAAADLIT